MRKYLFFMLFFSIVALPFSESFAACPGGSVQVGEETIRIENGKRIIERQCLPVGNVALKNLENARLVKNATSQGQLPPFQPLWDYYQYNRDIAKGFAPEENRCAMVLSMTLGLEPRTGEANLQQLGVTGGLLTIFKQIRSKMVIPQVSDAEIAKRYYVRAQQLANRLQDEFGSPLVVEGPKATEMIAGRKGILFIQNAYPRVGSLGGRSGDHIDIWNLDRIASSATLPFDKAGKVWFWEIP